MTKIMKVLIASAALATIFGASTQAALVPYTISELRSEYPELPSGFNDEKLYEVVMLDTALSMERELHLQPRWTGDDYARAYATGRLTRIRKQYEAPPNFTRDLLAENEAALEVNDFIAHHGVSAHFSQADLFLSEGTRRATENGVYGQKAAAGAKEYALLAGKSIADDFANDWHLSANWSFEELRATIGPEKAARLTRQYGIKAGMSHDEMVAATGKAAAADYARRLSLSANFTADDVVQHYGKKEIEFIREDYQDHGNDEVNEQWLLKHARARALANLQLTYPDLQGNFTEQQLLDYLTKAADTDMRDQYGFVGPYEEYDVAKAATESLLAETRIKYKLPLHFTEAQLEAAMKALPRFPYY